LSTLRRVLAVSICIALFIITIVTLVLFLESSWVRVIRHLAIMNNSYEVVYRFTPCDSESTPGLYIEIQFSATKPVTLFVVDEEQYRELFSRSDLYGYLAMVFNTSASKIGFYYAKSIPCWPIYIIAESVPDARIDLHIVIKKS